ncbi:MAG: hypothetical protein KA734_07310 [Fluviicola sp.]|nr:hypothetical protein [Fluviicola sp.]
MSLFMKDLYSNQVSFSQNNNEWLGFKVPFVIFFFMLAFDILSAYSSVNFPVAFCALGLCEWVSVFSIKLFIVFLLLLFSAAYIFEYKMKVTLGFLSIFSILLFSIEESNGIMNRASLMSMVFVAQWIAYFLYENQTNNLMKFRLQFGIQLVVATYMLSAISKLATSGFSWISDSQYAVLQIQKSIYYNFFDSNNTSFIKEGAHFVQFMNQHSTFFSLLFLSALVIEFTVFVALFNSKMRILYGFLLLAMHIGIFIVMDIIIIHVFIPMFLLLLNPFYYLTILLQGTFKRLKR